MRKITMTLANSLAHQVVQKVNSTLQTYADAEAVKIKDSDNYKKYIALEDQISKLQKEIDLLWEVLSDVHNPTFSISFTGGNDIRVRPRSIMSEKDIAHKIIIANEVEGIKLENMVDYMADSLLPKS